MPRKYLFSIIGTLLSVLLLFIGCEIIVRVAFPSIDLWGLTGRAPSTEMEKWAALDAFSAFTGKPGTYSLSPRKTVNSLGFISTPEISPKKKPGYVRILFLGGSSTAGTGNYLADSATWPWRVVAKLQQQKKTKSIDFINGALSGYSTFESYGRLWSRFRFFEPDIIVVYHGWNDMYYFNKRPMWKWRVRPDGSWSLKAKILHIKPHWIDHLIWPSQLLTYIRYRFADKLGEASRNLALSSNFNEKRVLVFRQNLRLIQNLAKLIGARLFVVKQATLITPSSKAACKRICHYQFHGFDHDAHVKAFGMIYAAIDEEFDKSQIIDARSLSGKKENFSDHIHPTVKGADRLSDIVVKSIAAEVAKRLADGK